MLLVADLRSSAAVPPTRGPADKHTPKLGIIVGVVIIAGPGFSWHCMHVGGRNKRRPFVWARNLYVILIKYINSFHLIILSI